MATWNLSLLKIVNMTYDLAASSIEGGRALDGLTGAIDFSGGGLWKMTASVECYQPEEHREWWRMAMILNGGVNSINMPFLADRFNFDPTGYTAQIIDSYSVGETEINLAVDGPSDGAGVLEEGMMFSVEHPSLSHRVYVIKELVSEIPIGSFTNYHVIIRPSLREEITIDTDVDFSQPLCRMRLPAGATMRWNINSEQFWWAQNDIELIEALPVEDPPY